jgi:hypothetical protein
MSQCTCTKDAQITCVVHPTEQALKARIAELEAVAEAAMAMPTISGGATKWAQDMALHNALRAAGYLKEQGDE